MCRFAIVVYFKNTAASSSSTSHLTIVSKGIRLPKPIVMHPERTLARIANFKCPIRTKRIDEFNLHRFVMWIPVRHANMQ